MRKKYTLSKTIIVMLLFCVMIANLYAGSARRRGTSGAQELLIPVGSVGTALGGSFVSALTGIEAAYWNPAGVADFPGTGEGMISRMNYIADIDVNYAAFVTKIGMNSAIGATLKTLDFGDIAVTTTSSPDGTGEIYSPQYINMGVLYSMILTDRIRFGFKADLISEQIMKTSATGFAINVGVQYAASPKGLKMGVVLRNLGGDMIFDGTDLEQDIIPPDTEPGTGSEPWRIPLSSFELPTQMEIGLSYGVFQSELMDLTVGGSFLNDNFSFDTYNFGAELAIAEMFYVRGSYSIAEDPDEHVFVSNTEDYMWGPGIGGGLNLKLGSTYMKLDYAYRTTKYFDNNQWISVRFGF